MTTEEISKVMIKKRNEEYTVPPIKPGPTRIVAAAVLQDGRVWVGPRHWRLIWNITKDTGKKVTSLMQGFWTDDGRWVSRRAAVWIAKKAGQLDEDFDKTLLSEYLWDVNGEPN